MLSVRNFVFLASFAVLFMTAGRAQAVGGMITVQQISNTKILGTWVLTTPEGKTYADHRGEYSQKIERVVGGTYTISVNPPQGARTSILVTSENNGVLSSAEGNYLSFGTVENDAVRVAITYRFSGTASIDSAPQGSSVTLRGGTFEFSGTTPVTFANVPPQHYSVDFGGLTGCISPRRQSRMLEPNETIRFYGVFKCGEEAVLEQNEPEKATEQPSAKLIRISLDPSQSETLPGGKVRYALTIRNTSKSTVTGLKASVQFDPETSLLTGVSDGGISPANGVYSWEIGNIYAGQRWSTNFYAIADEDLKAGDIIYMTARVQGQGLVESGMREQELAASASSSIGVAILPKTGMRSDAAFAALLSIAGLIFAFSISRKRFVEETA